MILELRLDLSSVGFEVSKTMKLMKSTFCAAAVAVAAFSPAIAAAQDLSTVPVVDEIPTQAVAESVAAPAETAQGVGYHSGWAILSENGELRGTAWTMTSNGPAPVAGATVAVMVGNDLVASAESDDQGKYTIPGLDAGVFTIKTTAANACSAFIARFVPSSLASTQPGMDVYCVSMSPSELESIVGSMWVPGSTPTMIAQQSAELEMPGAQSYVVRRVNGVVQGQLVFATANIGPLGHVIRLYQNGKLIEEAQSDARGRFTLTSDVTGPVDIVVGGPGYAAMGAMIVDSATEVTNVQKNSNERFVAKLAKPAAVQSSVLFVPVVSQFPGTPVDGTVVVDEGAPLPLGAAPAPGFAGGGGGFGGGGGGGGFGGGGGGLLGIAGLAVGITALASDDDGFNLNPATPISN
jgi:hypothetical protein